MTQLYISIAMLAASYLLVCYIAWSQFKKVRDLELEVLFYEHLQTHAASKVQKRDRLGRFVKVVK